MTTPETKLTELQTELLSLRAEGVFRYIPVIEERHDGRGTQFVFRKRGQVVCDPKVPFIRTIGLPKNNYKKWHALIKKKERTEKAAELVKQIQPLEEENKKKAEAEIKAKHLLHTVANLRKQAAELISKADQLEHQAQMLNT